MVLAKAKVIVLELVVIFRLPSVASIRTSAEILATTFDCDDTLIVANELMELA